MMKYFLVTFFLALLTIVSSTDTISNPELLRNEDVGFMKQQYMESQKVLENLCQNQTKNGQAYANIQKEIAAAGECINNTVMNDNFFANVYSDFKEGNIQKGFDTSCSKFPAFHACGDKVLKAVQVCLNEEMKIGLSILVKLMIKSQTYICKEGKHIIEFIELNGFECIKDHILPIAKCFDNALTTYEFDGFMMSAKDCKFYSATTDCLVQSVTTAECAKPKKYLETSFKTAYDQSLCKGI